MAKHEQWRPSTDTAGITRDSNIHIMVKTSDGHIFFGTPRVLIAHPELYKEWRHLTDNEKRRLEDEC